MMYAIIFAIIAFLPIVYIVSFWASRGFHDGKFTAIERAIRRNSKGIGQ